MSQKMSSAIDVTWQQQYNLYLHDYRYHYQNYQRYLTGINETAEDTSLQRKPGCPKLGVNRLDVIDGDCSFELFTRIFEPAGDRPDRHRAPLPAHPHPPPHQPAPVAGVNPKV